MHFAKVLWSCLLILTMLSVCNSLAQLRSQRLGWGVGAQVRQTRRHLSMEVGQSGAALGLNRLPLPVNIYVDTDIRSFLKMKNADRKTKIHLSQKIDPSIMGIQALRAVVEKKHVALRGQPYDLLFQLTENTATSGGYGNLACVKPRAFESDAEVSEMLERATSVSSLREREREREPESDKDKSVSVKDKDKDGSIQKETENLLNKGQLSLQLFVDVRPGVFPPISDDSEQAYLKGMPDPKAADTVTMISFYRFHDIKDPEDMSREMMVRTSC